MGFKGKLMYKSLILLILICSLEKSISTMEKSKLCAETIKSQSQVWEKTKKSRNQLSFGTKCQCGCGGGCSDCNCIDNNCVTKKGKEKLSLISSKSCTKTKSAMPRPRIREITKSCTISTEPTLPLPTLPRIIIEHLSNRSIRQHHYLFHRIRENYNQLDTNT